MSEFSQGHELLAYTLATGVSDEPNDIEVSHHHSHFTSDGTTIWLIRNNAATLKVIAYTLATGARDESKDITLAEVNRDGSGLAKDGETLWVSDDGDDRLYAYNLSTGARDIGKEFDLHPDNGLAGGMWTDNAFIWVLDVWRDRAYAYNLADGSRVPGKDYYPLDSQHTWPSGIWSNGTTTWIANYYSDTVFAHAAYPLAKYLRATSTATKAQLKLTRHTGNWYYKDAADTSAVCSAAPTAVQTGTTVNLTGLTPGTTYTYTAYSDSSCTSDKALASVRFATSAPVLTAFYGNTLATLTLSGWTIGTGTGQDGNWWYKHDNTGAACTPNDTTGLSVATTHPAVTAGDAYTFTAYRDSNCANAIDAAPAFIAHGDAPTLVVGEATATTMQLTLRNYSGPWWYKYTVPTSPAGVCTAVSGAAEARATGLTKTTSYTFKAYRAEGCDSADVIATAAAKSTTTPDLRVSKIKSRTATLTLGRLGPGPRGPLAVQGNSFSIQSKLLLRRGHQGRREPDFRPRLQGPDARQQLHLPPLRWHVLYRHSYRLGNLQRPPRPAPARRIRRRQELCHQRPENRGDGRPRPPAFNHRCGRHLVQRDDPVVALPGTWGSWRPSTCPPKPET